MDETDYFFTEIDVELIKGPMLLVQLEEQLTK